jgi:hypothetical protein
LTTPRLPPWKSLPGIAAAVVEKPDSSTCGDEVRVEEAASAGASTEARACAAGASSPPSRRAAWASSALGVEPGGEPSGRLVVASGEEPVDPVDPVGLAGPVGE